MPDAVSGQEDMIRGYRAYTARKIAVIIAIFAVLVVAAGFSMTVGIRSIGFFDSFRILFDHLGGATYDPGSAGWRDDRTIWDIRVPRVLAAVIVGFGLAVSGVAMQSITKNPLADPYTTGMSSGAHFGVALSMALGIYASTGMGRYGSVFNAFVFGMVPALIVIALSNRRNSSPATVILVGVAISYFFSSLSTLVVMRADPADIKDIYNWQLGTLESMDWDSIPMMALVVAVGSVILMLLSSKLNVLSLASGNAKTMGVDADTYRTLILVVIAFITSIIVGFCGIIGFLGLVAPHIMRLLIGGDNRFLLPAAGLFGSMFLLVADTIGRSVISPDVIPVGVVMSFIGSPIFLYLVLRMKREVWRCSTGSSTDTAGCGSSVSPSSSR